MRGADVGSLLEGFCLYKHHIGLLFAICLGLFGLSVLSVIFLEPGSAGFIISVINSVTLAVFLIPSAALLWYCRDIE